MDYVKMRFPQVLDCSDDGLVLGLTEQLVRAVGLSVL